MDLVGSPDAVLRRFAAGGMGPIGYHTAGGAVLWFGRFAFFFWQAPFFAHAQTPCEQLKSLSLPNLTITAAETLPAGSFPAPGTTTQAPVTLPARCRLAAVLTPSTDSRIEMELWLPTENWNGKFQAVGNGGWAGTITFGSGNPQPVANTMVSALKEGYAVASNDTGHKGRASNASFALDHPEKLVDFGSRSVHEMAVKSKTIIEVFYGRRATFSYWNGCSTGGRQGLTEAQRYPEDFDGIVAGAPANYWTHLMVGIVRSAQATHKDQPGNMPAAKLALLHDAVIQACDGLDGVRDAVLGEPTRCKFRHGASSIPEFWCAKAPTSRDV
jgi:feruloyl esterase